MALSAFSFGLISIFVIFATRSGAPLLSVLTWRYASAALLLAAVAWGAGVRGMSTAAWRVVVFAGLAQAIVAVLSMSALRFIHAGTLGFLFYTFPAWVALIARVRDAEPLTPLRLFALVLSLSGIFVMVGVGPGLSLHPAGVALALAAAVVYAAYIPMIRALQRGLNDAEAAACISLGATVFLAAAAAALGDLTLQLEPVAWLSVAGLSLVSTVAAFLFFLRGLRVLGSVRTAIVSTVEPFFTALVGAWLLGQPLTRRTLAGGVLIALAVTLLNLRNNSGTAGRAG